MKGEGEGEVREWPPKTTQKLVGRANPQAAKLRLGREKNHFQPIAVSHNLNTFTLRLINKLLAIKGLYSDQKLLILILNSL